MVSKLVTIGIAVNLKQKAAVIFCINLSLKPRYRAIMMVYT